MSEKKFTSLQDFGRDFKVQAAQQKQEAELQAQDRRQARFDSLMKDSFSNVPNGNFTTLLKGIDTLSITRYPEEEPTRLNITLFFQHQGRDMHETLTLSNDGLLAGRLPRELQHLSREQIYDDLLDLANRLQPQSIVQVDVDGDILPPGVWDEKVHRDEPEETSRDRKPVRTVRERLDLMTSQPDLLFQFNGTNSRIRGYTGYVFTWGIVFENPKAANAAFVYDFEQPLDVDDQQLNQPLGQRISQIDIQQVLDQHWKPLLKDRTKGELVDLGLAKRVPHKSGDQWIEQMSGVLQEHRVKSAKTE